MTTLVQDLRYAFRTFVRTPGFTAVAVLTLALGIGANTALFSIVNGVLLNPLPYPHPERLVSLAASKPHFATGSISYPNFVDWQKDNHTFSALAIYRNAAFILSGSGDAERLRGEFISSDFFRILDVQPVLGRTFRAGEDRIGAAPIALISAGLWQRRFGRTLDIVGRPIRLDGREYTIVGVIPAAFDLDLSMGGFHASDVYVPIGQWSNPVLSRRSAGLGIHGIGRVRAGVTIEQARADLQAVARNLAAAYPADNKDVGASVIPLQQQIVGRIRPFLLLLLGAVGFVLLIACVNIGNLVLARSAGRGRELAVRAALGASRARLIRQFLTESVLLAGAGGVVGLGVAAWGTQAALMALPSVLPRAREVGIDGHVLAFTTAVTVASGIVFGLVPALRASRPALQHALKDGGRGGTASRHRLQAALVVVELALSLVLLVGAGLMTRTLAQLWNVDPGFRPDNVLTFDLALDPSMGTAPAEAVRATYRAVEARILHTPGVEAVSLSAGAFPMGYDDEDLFWFAGEPRPASLFNMKMALSYVVDPAYFRVMGLTLERGRFLTAQDDEHAPTVVVVDDVFARSYFGNRNPIGQRLNLSNWDRQAEIVGVVRHVKQWGLDSDDSQSLRAQIYKSFMQMPDSQLAAGGSTVVLRTAGPIAGLVESLRRTLTDMNSQQVLYGAQTMTGMIAGSLAARRFAMILLAAFALLALFLSSIGIYGVVAYLVKQRTQEIGIRMALGAADTDVLGLVLRDGMRMALAGAGLGLAASLALTRFMKGMLYGVSVTDPLTFALVAAVLLAVALAACYLPARRALRVDPLRALRCD
ncbi:MAG: ABC transporter permease [Acidobacteriota bacterium]|nr:ABC transporter permease [Acidobacteriota bacterium]